MRKKQFYEAPDAELLVVRFEKNIMSQEPGKPNRPFGAPSRSQGFDDDVENY